MSLRHRVTKLSLSIILLMNATPADAASPALRVTLDGRTIAARTAGHWQCHDLDYPRIQCYRSRATLERAVHAYLARPGGASGSTLAVDSGVAYVHVYENAGYLGASMYLSQDYANLGTIGWNDRITSFKVVNGGSGVFRRDAGPGGASYSFCCGSQVSNIGSTWNDQISAVTGST